MYINNIIFNNDLCNEVYDKKTSLKAHKKSIQTLFVGTSHTNYGINPAYFDSTTFNFGLTSLDMKGMYHLLNMYIKILPNLENVFIEMSIFSPGFDLIKTSDKWMAFYYKEILGIPYDVDADTKQLQSWKKQAKTRKVKNDYYGYKKQTWFGNWIAQDRYETHLKHCLRVPKPLKYLKLIDKLCVNNGKRLIVFVPPCRNDYESFISVRVKELLKRYVSIYAPNAEFYSFLSNKSFSLVDFGDTDHLKHNTSGVLKLAKKMNNIIKMNKKITTKNNNKIVNKVKTWYLRISMLKQYNKKVGK